MATTKTKTMRFNGKHYLSKGTCCNIAGLPADYNGFFDAQVGKTYLYDRVGTMSAVIISNKRQGHFLACAREVEGGVWHTYGDDLIKVWTGLDKVLYSDKSDVIRAIEVVDGIVPTQAQVPKRVRYMENNASVLSVCPFCKEQFKPLTGDAPFDVDTGAPVCKDCSDSAVEAA